MSQTETPLTPPLRPGPLYPLLPDESDDIVVDVMNTIPNAALWLDTPNPRFGLGTPRSVIGTDQEWFLRNMVRMVRYGQYS